MSRGCLQMSRVQRQVLLLLGQVPVLSHAEIARLVGCSRKTVCRLVARTRPESAEVSDRLERYRGQLRAKVPLAHRARRYRELVDQGDQAMVSLKALMHLDSVEGLIPERGQYEGAPLQPLFALPPGTRGAILLECQPVPPAAANVKALSSAKEGG